MAEPLVNSVSVRGHCQARKMRYVRDDAPTCLPGTVLRDMLKTFHAHAVNPVDEKAFRPYSVHGGRDGASNHRTKAGLLRTVNQALEGIPEQAWVEPDVAPENPYLRQLVLRQPHQQEALAGVLQRQYFKPTINAATDTQFRNTLLTTDLIHQGVVNATSHLRSFAFLGVARPVYSGTQQLLANLHQFWRVQSRGRPRYKVFGVVWNTDPREEGSHWVAALFFPFQRRYEYFDSMANPPPEVVGCQMKLVKQELARFADFPNKDWNGEMNTVVHQRGGIQCGMYSIWFIVQRLVEKRSWLDIARHPTHDADICALRPDHFARMHSRVHKTIQERQARLAREMAREDAKIAAQARKLERQAKADIKKHGQTREDAILIEARRYGSKKASKPAPTAPRVRIRPVEGREKDQDAQDNHIFKESRCPRVEIQRFE